MRSHKEEFRMPHDLVSKAKQRCSDEGYRSRGRYYLGLVLRDVIAPQRHSFSAAIANLDWEEQDEVLDALLTMNSEQLRNAFLSTVRAIGEKTL